MWESFVAVLLWIIIFSGPILHATINLKESLKQLQRNIYFVTVFNIFTTLTHSMANMQCIYITHANISNMLFYKVIWKECFVYAPNILKKCTTFNIPPSGVFIHKINRSSYPHFWTYWMHLICHCITQITGWENFNLNQQGSPF